MGEPKGSGNLSHLSYNGEQINVGIQRLDVFSSVFSTHAERRTHMGKILTRMGDGTLTEMSESELKQDLETGTRDGADKADVPPLHQDELDYLLDIFTTPAKFASVELGSEVVLSFDGGTLKTRRLGVATGRIQAIQFFERALGADTMELAHIDYSYKQIKPIAGDEQPVLEQALLVSTVPLFYGAMPNLGIYSQPDGPVPNPAELLPQGKIKEARAAHEEAVEHAVRDMVYVGSKMAESGADGINFDTTGAAGDPDFLATLRATEILKKRYPDMCIELGMAGEFILGMHGEMSYDGVRLAGLYPHEQVKLAQKAGVTIFGPVVNTNTSQSSAWNLARTLTLLKPCVERSTIPVHANVGMGVGSTPVVDNPPTDAVSKASKALVEIVRIDGL
jgi:dimethylamine--corrinoid protein Co-methyltransferase